MRSGSGAPGRGSPVTLAPAESGRGSSGPCARGSGAASTACAEPLSAPPGEPRFRGAFSSPGRLFPARLRSGLPAPGPGFPAPWVQPLLAAETCPGAFGVQPWGVQAWPLGDRADHSPPSEPASQAGGGVEIQGQRGPMVSLTPLGQLWSLLLLAA